MKTTQGAQKNIWDIIAAVMAGLLFLDFITLLVMFFSGAEALLDPVFAIVTAILMLLGLFAYLFAGKKGASKALRRCLLAMLICGFISVIGICAMAVILIIFTI